MDKYCKYKKLRRQISYDGGKTWNDMDEYDTGDLIERNSPDCGYKPTPIGDKLYVTNSDGTSRRVFCNDNSTLTSGDTQPNTTERTNMVSAKIGDCVDAIEENAFYNCYVLTSVTISDSVTSIGINAFYNCRSLTSINIPSGITSIGDRTFSNCRSLTSITIPDKVISIGQQAFIYCTGLTSITIPSGVTSIGDSAFAYCSGLTSVTISDNVTKIGNYAFTYCSGLTSINIPNSVETIGDNVFVGCSSLTDVHIGTGVRSIGNNAFYGCPLKTIDIPDNVESIGESAFYACSGLTSINIPDKVTSIGSYAFQRCSGLTSVTFLAETPPTLGSSVFAFTNNCPIYVPCESFDTYKTNWSDYADRIRRIDDDCIEPTPPTPIDEKLNVTYKNGTSRKVFCNDNSTLTRNEAQPNTTDKTNIVSVKIGDCVSTIEEWAFNGCSGMTSVHIGTGVTSIGSAAFGNCSGLTSMTILAETPPTIDGFVFGGTSNCKFYVPCKSLEKYRTADVWSYFPYRIKPIEDDCIDTLSTKFKATYSDNRTYELDCNNDSTLKSSESRPDGYDSKTMVSSEIGDCVNVIGSRTFQDCSGLTTVHIGNGVTEIQECAFSGCTGLKSIDIPNNVKIIGFQAFQSCSGLTSVHIGTGVTEIKGYAFGWCTGLKSITILAETPPTLSGKPFYVIECPIYVPCKSFEKYRTADGWEEVVWRINPIEDDCITTIGNKFNATYSDGISRKVYCNNNSTLTRTEVQPDYYIDKTTMVSADIGDCVNEIGDSAFYQCSGLTSVHIGTDVTNIGRSALRNCSSLTSITIPSGVISIGDYAFYQCSSLTSITVLATTPPTIGGYFTFTATNECPIYVPDASVDAYKSASIWSNYYAYKIKPLSEKP